MRHVTHMNESRHTYEAHSKVEEIAVAEGSDERAVEWRAPYCYLCDMKHIDIHLSSDMRAFLRSEAILVCRAPNCYLCHMTHLSVEHRRVHR